MNARISIIIPTYNNWQTLKTCLQGLKNQHYPNTLFKVLIVNNAPENPCPYMDELPGNFSILEETTRGSYAARNAGIKAAQSDILGFTDSDCIPDTEWIRKAAGYFAGKDTYVLAGKVDLFSKHKKPNAIESYDMFDDFHISEWVNNYEYAVTANLFVRKSLFERIGLFREDLFSGGDTEWTRRAVANGYQLVYADDVTVRHPARDSFGELSLVRRRRLGGLYVIDRVHDHPIHKKALKLLKLLSPPFRLFRMKRFRDLSRGQRMKFFIIRYRIKFCELREYLGLLFGRKAGNY